MRAWWRWWVQTAPRVPQFHSSDYVARTEQSAARAREAAAQLAEVRQRLTRLELAALAHAHNNDEDESPPGAQHV